MTRLCTDFILHALLDAAKTITFNYSIVNHYAIKIFRFSWAAFSKSGSKWSRSITQTTAHIAKNAVKIAWTRPKSAPTDRCYPISFLTSHFGSSEKSISRSFHFLGKVCDLDGRHMTVPKKIFSLCHAFCSAIGRFPEPFTQYLEGCDADADELFWLHLKK